MRLRDDCVTTPVLNLPKLLELVENDRELLAELVGIFKEQFPLLLKSLQEAMASEDMKGLEAIGHTLKGMLSNLCATRAALTAEHIERMGREHKRSGLKDALSALEAEGVGLSSELDAYMAESLR
jgi:HPt (histidine-containing phosphotransfer) domain-containing protein